MMNGKRLVIMLAIVAGLACPLECSATPAKAAEAVPASIFWSKGFIRLHSEDGVADSIEQNYTYYLYIMASSSRGRFPAKFNEMIWITGGDKRSWGGHYWGANQECMYNALPAANANCAILGRARRLRWSAMASRHKTSPATCCGSPRRRER